MPSSSGTFQRSAFSLSDFLQHINFRKILPAFAVCSSLTIAKDRLCQNLDRLRSTKRLRTHATFKYTTHRHVRREQRSRWQVRQAKERRFELMHICNHILRPLTRPFPQAASTLAETCAQSTPMESSRACGPYVYPHLVDIFHGKTSPLTRSAGAQGL